MERERVNKHKSWLYLLLILVLMVCRTQGGCVEEERKALLEIKASLIDTHVSNVNHLLPTWFDHGSTGENGDECCNWERVKCNTTTWHVTHLSLSNMMEIAYKDCERIWPLNVSLFFHFKELTSLNLSYDCLNDWNIVNTGVERLSSLKKLEILDLSSNYIGTFTVSSLGALTSLRNLHLGDNELDGVFPALALENLEILDLTNAFNQFYKWQGFERVSLFKKLEILNLAGNEFNESIITSLSALPLLKVLDLTYNKVYGSFPAAELAGLTSLEELNLSWNRLDQAPRIQDCKRLSSLKKLKSIALGGSHVNKNVVSCLSALPFLTTLDLSRTYMFGIFFPLEELYDDEEYGTLDLHNSGLESLTLNDLSHFRNLKVLLLGSNGLNGTRLMEASASFHHLEVLDLSYNKFVGIPSTINASSSLRVISFANNNLKGSLLGLCELKNLHMLDLSGNMFDGNLPHCFNSLSSLKMLDISHNLFTGILMPSPIANLTSLEYVDFSNNKFEGSFLLSSFSNHTKLEVVKFVSDNDKFVVETEEPVGWVPTFQLKVLKLSCCNLNRVSGSVVPRFLLHQHDLLVLDLSHNSLVGQIPNWLIESNTTLKALILRSNSFSGIICMPLKRNANIRYLDISENHMNGSIPSDIHKFLPNITYLNLSSNSLVGVIPSTIGDMGELWALDLSNNELSGKVPKELFTNLSLLVGLKLSNNRLHGKILSGNLSLGRIGMLHLDNNFFTGKIGNGIDINLGILDISNNYFTGTIPKWISNMTRMYELKVGNNSLEGQFPCGTAPFAFLDISQNSFSGPIPSCLILESMLYLHLGSNRFTGSIPNVFRTLTNVLTLDIGNNLLSGRIPGFLGELSSLRILILRNNNFSGSIPRQLCQLSNVSLMDLSTNSLSGSIPSCLQNIATPVYPAFMQYYRELMLQYPDYVYHSVLQKVYRTSYDMLSANPQEVVMFTTKMYSLSYKGGILDLMVGLDLSCNNLSGEIPGEIGLLTHIHSLNLSHNQLFGPIPVSFSDLVNIESLDLSSNNLSGEVPSQLIKLNSLAVFNVSFNNLSGRLPETKAQFGTFTNASYEGNPLLCGPPLEKKCIVTTHTLTENGTDKWYGIDMACFYGSSSSTWVVFLLGFAAVLYVNPYWRRRWLDLVEDYMYTCYYFLDDSVRKVSSLFHE